MNPQWNRRGHDRAAATAPARSRVLVVDDRSDKLMTVAAALAPLGREITTVGTGRDALRCLLRDDFAVILLDVNMPGMDGFDTARLIRQRPRNRQTPIIFITSYGDDLHAREGYSLGAVDFMLSPIAPEILRSKVEVLLELDECTIEIRRQAFRLEERTRQLQTLTRASLAIHAADSIDRALQIAVDSARQLVNGQRAWGELRLRQWGFKDEKFAVSPPDAADRDPLEERAARRSKRAVDSQLAADGSDEVLSAVLRGRDGSVIGTLVVCGQFDQQPTIDDEALLIQLAQMTGTAVENTLFAEAREANRLKDEFLATLSHELRTPLSAILGWSQLLRSKLLDADETAEALEIIERNGQMQHKLIEDLLDISRIVTGKLQLNLKSLDLAGVIQAAVDVTLPSAQAKHVELDVSLAQNTSLVLGDADRLQQVLWNLLSNAVKFTPTQGRIEVRLENSADQVQITVRDSGEGISAEFLPYVFDRFRQADSSASRRHGGLGIGLAIVRHIVELHGGNVRAESAGKGNGTTIALTLPAHPSEFPPSASPAESGVVVSLSTATAEELSPQEIPM